MRFNREQDYNNDINAATLYDELFQFGGDWHLNTSSNYIHIVGDIKATRDEVLSVILAHDPVDHVKSVSKLQFVEWCEATGNLNKLMSLLNSDASLKFKWDAALSLEVEHPLVQGAAQKLGMNAQEVFDVIGN